VQVGCEWEESDSIHHESIRPMRVSNLPQANHPAEHQMHSQTQGEVLWSMLSQVEGIGTRANGLVLITVGQPVPRMASYEVVLGDCLTELKAMEGGRFHSCITSPPYFMLRDYGTDEQIGNEESLDDYIAKMVEVMREVRRVLRDDGVLWLNIGDSYNGSGGAGGDYNKGGWKEGQPRYGKKDDPRFKPKDLMLVPHRLAIALQEDGWFLRQDIVWAKNNPMPEPAKDRCVKAHEYVFLLSKSRHYFFDHIAIQEPVADSKRTNYACGGRTNGINHDRNDNDMRERSLGIVFKTRNKRSVWTVNTKAYAGAHFAVFPPELIEPCVLTTPTKCCAECGQGYERVVKDRALTDEEVHDLMMTPEGDDVPYTVKELGHGRSAVVEFRDLPPPKVLATYLNDARKRAGLTIKEVEERLESRAPHHWFEMGDSHSYPSADEWPTVKELFDLDDRYDEQMTNVKFKSGIKGENEPTVYGWAKACVCETDETKPAVVLDPFGGSGTTAGVAVKNQRDAVLIEVNSEYAKLIPNRVKSIVGYDLAEGEASVDTQTFDDWFN